ncbi:MAG: C-type lectin domain-containing protein, partial [Verrucomicrobiota bacterium]
FVTPISWDKAKSLAESMGGYLVCINSQEENEFVARLFGKRTVFIGGTDAETEGEWTWLSGEPVTFAQWQGGEPNNKGEEDVMVMNGRGEWLDVPVSGRFGKTGVVEGYVVEWDR